MAIDYKALADNDPGGDLVAAFELLAAQTVDTRPVAKMSYLDIASQVNYVTSAALERVVTFASANPVFDGKPLAGWVKTALETTGIDVNNPQTAGLLNQMVGNDFTADMAAAIVQAGVVVVNKYPGITPQHLKKARVLRQEGKV